MEKQGDRKNPLASLSDRHFKGIIFDFDETLFHLAIDWRGLKASLTSILRDHYPSSHALTPLAKRVFDLRASKHPVYPLIFETIVGYEKQGLEQGNPNVALIEFIRNDNRPFAIYSMNTSKTITAFINTYGLNDKFHHIHAQDTCIAPKPAPYDLLHIADKWGYNKTEILFIGNSIHDSESGRLANIRTELISM